MATLLQFGLISGQKATDGTLKLNPNGSIKRSQFTNMLYQIENNYVGKYVIIEEELNQKYKDEFGKTLSDIVKSNSNEYIEYFNSIRNGEDRVLSIPDYGTAGGKVTHEAFEVLKEGEVIFEEYDLKLIISKDSNGEWKLESEKIVKETPTTTEDTATM